MNLGSQTDGTPPLASELRLSDEAIADEIRIVQSVQNQQNMPALLIGSLSSILLILMIDFKTVISGPIIFLLALEFALLVPMLRSYLKLRGRPVPLKVSKRRIQTIERYTLIMGVFWAVAALFIMASFSRVDSVAAMLVLFCLTYGGSALTPSLPRAAASFAVPVMPACFVGALVNDVMSPGVLLALCLAASIVFARTTIQSWQDVRSRVRLGLQNVEAEARRARDMEEISTRLGKYMSPQLYQSIFSGTQTVEIASRRKKLTVFFSDIARFTEITKELEAEEVTELLNRYLTEMSDIALAHGGTIDKFIGDAIVVFFGDPHTRGVKEDAVACVRMALAMQEKLRDLGKEWLELGVEEVFELRIGINTGYCTVGNFGSADRMDYTIIGSEVNLAARLESASEVGGILLANETYSLVKDLVMADSGDLIEAKGFSKPVKTFRLRGLRSQDDSAPKSVTHEDDGISLRLDAGRLTGKNRARARDALREALQVLEAQQGKDG